MKSISIIIPAKNEEQYLGRTLYCLMDAAEKYGGPVEIILMDNGSTDQTIDIARSYGCKIKTLLDVSIAGLRNAGAAISVGEVLAFLDADCLVDPAWIVACVKHFELPGIGMVGTPAIPDLSCATWVEQGWYNLVTGVYRPNFPKWIGTSNMFILRSVFEGINGFDENLETAEDVQICDKVLETHKIFLDNKIKTIHLRESKTILDLFKREVWRGKSSLRHFLLSNRKKNEIISTFFPVLSILILFLMTFFLFIDTQSAVLLAILFLGMPIILLLKKRAIYHSFSEFVNVYAVALVYINSRGIAFFCEIKDMVSKV